MGLEEIIKSWDKLLEKIEEDKKEFKKLREELEGMNKIYHRFRVECKSENGESYTIDVDTVDMIEAYKMVEDTGLDGYIITSITLIARRT
jgi:DNA gyrase/topoisomerase IV subunit A